MAEDPFDRIRFLLNHRERQTLEEESRFAPGLRPGVQDAAVLLPMFELDGRLQLLFTLRTQTVRHHKGQVSFPGGARDPEDASLQDTALRETFEEIGVPTDHIDVLGPLDDMVTISMYRVTPFVARIPWPVDLHPNEREIESVFHVPIETFLDYRNCRLETREHNGLTVYPIYWFDGGPHPVWGITGHILSHFLEVAFDWDHPDLCRERMTPRTEWLTHIARSGLATP